MRILKNIFLFLFMVILAEIISLLYISSKQISNKYTNTINNNSQYNSEKKVTTKLNNKSINLSQYNLEKDILTNLDDINYYLNIIKRKEKLKLKKIDEIDGYYLLELLKNNPKDTIILDVREKYELLFIKFYKTPIIYELRIGDLINDNYDKNKLSKNKQIIIVSSTNSRAYIAANYLLQNGFSNIKVLKKGLIYWQDILPLKNNSPVETLKYVTKFYEIKDLQIFKEHLEFLDFGPVSENKINMLTISTPKLNSFIDNLPKNKLYIIRCNTSHYCYDAVNFWYLARDKISIIGYTRYIDENYAY